jgi:hypothetical protein
MYVDPDGRAVSPSIAHQYQYLPRPPPTEAVVPPYEPPAPVPPPPRPPPPPAPPATESYPASWYSVMGPQAHWMSQMFIPPHPVAPPIPVGSPPPEDRPRPIHPSMMPVSIPGVCACCSDISDDVAVWCRVLPSRLCSTMSIPIRPAPTPALHCSNVTFESRLSGSHGCNRSTQSACEPRGCGTGAPSPRRPGFGFEPRGHTFSHWCPPFRCRVDGPRF